MPRQDSEGRPRQCEGAAYLGLGRERPPLRVFLRRDAVSMRIRIMHHVPHRSDNAPPMHRCAFCGLGLPRRDRFFAGLGDAAICDCCTELAIELGKSPSSPREMVTGGPSDVSCRFCGRGLSDCEPGSLVGRVPTTFICTDCERLAAEALEVT